jgi:hypothetical protein
MREVNSEARQLVGHAETAMFQAELAPPENREKLFFEAKDLLIRAETHQPGIGCWHLACISARLGQGSLCHKWLMRAKFYGMSPDKAALESNPHLAPLRREQWFRQFLNELE